MGLFGKENARLVGIEHRIESVLDSINPRLDALESAPGPDKNVHDLILNLTRTVDTLEAALTTLSNQIVDVEGKLKATNFAVSEGIERTDRAERRIHATIKRARKELKDRGYEDPGLEAEAHELRVVDGGGGGDGEVQPVSEDVAPAGDQPSSVPGVSRAALAKVRGYYGE